MIPLTRDRSPEVIHSNFIGESKDSLEEEVLVDERSVQLGEIDQHAFNSDKWKPAKEQLVIETANKCAYCEAPTMHVAYGDVEHYRPKSVYWWLAYSYDNYLVSCTLCNQKYKSADFPVKGPMMAAPAVAGATPDATIEAMAGHITPNPLDVTEVEHFLQLHQQERPLLLNPYFDEPTRYFAWQADGVTLEVYLTPVPDESDAPAFCDAAIEFYGLNRLELCQYRWWVYEQYWIYRAFLEDGGADPALLERTRAMMEKMKSLEAPYAGMIRYFDRLPFEALTIPPVS